MIRVLAIAFVFGSSCSALASGAMHLTGKVKSFDPNAITIVSAGDLWKLDRSKLDVSLQKSLSSIRSDQVFDAWISFAAVESVEHVRR